MIEKREVRKKRLNILLGIIITIYGVMATGVSYRTNQLGTSKDKMMFMGLKELTKGNDAYAVADQIVNDDATALVQIELLEATSGSAAAIEIWELTLSEFALAALERSGELDDDYDVAVYEYAEEFYENSDLAFDVADEFIQIEGEHELILLLFAIGVTFSGWASLLEDTGRLRVFFAGVSLFILVVALGLWFISLSIPAPLEILPL